MTLKTVQQVQLCRDGHTSVSSSPKLMRVRTLFDRQLFGIYFLLGSMRPSHLNIKLSMSSTSGKKGYSSTGGGRRQRRDIAGF